MQHLIAVLAWGVFAVGVLGGLPNDPIWTGIFFVATAIIILQAFILAAVSGMLIWHFLYGTGRRK